MVKPFRRSGREQAEQAQAVTPSANDLPISVPVPIPDHDPLMAYLLGAGGPIDVDKVDLDSPALRELRAAGVQLVVPLVSQGELIGTLVLGKRLSDPPYSIDDR
jgi:hypothetical protein